MSDRIRRKILQGTVVSNKMDKTIVVRVSRRIKHPLYEKYIVRSKKFMVHDAHNVCRIRDEVSIIESRPLSRRKRWRLLEVVKQVSE